jgi:protein-serine/threonine kinase
LSAGSVAAINHSNANGQGSGATTPNRKQYPPGSPAGTAYGGVNPYTASDLLRRAMSTITTTGSAAPAMSKASSHNGVMAKLAQDDANTTNVAVNGEDGVGEQAEPMVKGASVGPPKGKLLVRILEARGLRPCYDPYVVCVFDWNEYISKGPRESDVDMLDRDEGSGNDDLGGVPIRRSASDMGRPMAIPMKSRQTSNTSSTTDQKEFRANKAITDPKWDHDATL